MQRSTGGTVFEPVQPERRDREVTLGPFRLALIGCGLFFLCGLCFVFGYAVGHRSPEPSAAISQPPPAAPVLMPATNAQSKPSAAQGEAQSTAASAEMTEPADAEAASRDAATSPSGATAEPSAGPAAASSDPAARTVAASQPVAQISSGSTVQSAPAPAIMVQIAAVSHSEDADVLVGALRKRGYAVVARRDPADGLLHVQIGPFANRNDAYAMRQKLLNDGYNAIVQP
jgi:DedD protein